MNDPIQIQKKDPSDVIVALVGCPNVGKSTLFNALTGRNQHTGNWPGKTVAVASGRYRYKGRCYILVDLPGTYSLVCQSQEEKVTTDFLRSGSADCTVVLADATCLERTLLPALQVMELTNNMIVGVNLMDEAERHDQSIDIRLLEQELGVPTVGLSAGAAQGLDALLETIRNLTDGFLPSNPKKVPMEAGFSIFDWGQTREDKITAAYSNHAEMIVQNVLGKNRVWAPSPVDRIVLHKWGGRLILGLLLFVIFWLTIKAANVPSTLLQNLFDWIKYILTDWTFAWPVWLQGILLHGVYHTVTCVIAVMLPPLLIFFPLFSILEDLGYLPRAAFLLDRSFQKCGSCGKQALTMAMGFGCNAAAVTGTRIISSTKERLLAIITNSLVPCNGRFPAMIVLTSIFFSEQDWIAAVVLTTLIMLGVSATFLSTKVLSNTIFYKEESNMLLELPPYRRPNLKTILSKSLVDRVFSVLFRAISVAAPAGALIWIMQHVTWNEMSLLQHLVLVSEPIGSFLGMNGVIMTAFILSFPANELLLPSIIMLLSTQAAAAVEQNALGTLLFSNGWSTQTAVCTLVFLLFHWPCSTTCLTIRKETGSWKWTIVSVLLPLIIGTFLCALISQL